MIDILDLLLADIGITGKNAEEAKKNTRDTLRKLKETQKQVKDSCEELGEQRIFVSEKGKE